MTTTASAKARRASPGCWRATPRCWRSAMARACASRRRLSIRRADAPVGETEAITIVGKGQKSRSAPIIAPVRRAVEDYLKLCPYALKPAGPLFVGAKGGPLSPRIVQLAMARMRGALGLPEARRRMRCAIRSPRICWRAAGTCARSRTCSATPRCRPRRSIRASTARACSPPIAAPIRAREGAYRRPPALLPVSRALPRKTGFHFFAARSKKAAQPTRG